uniref:Uncharacterized protein n=1 Tax=Tetranychus urticae TaxID=32264 RepID=T1K9P9_TETUR
MDLTFSLKLEVLNALRSTAN